ncbi:tRNA epoxyqueuosine(34) reductase QueG [Alkaliphilus oremlandii]|uniref:4Fe-4S ferredoxin-type domain-containing protein n=1 Tax=Alkaliphilus oremlandii (strain OhILAs) TaxID=350688 RepID=A8MEX5_ALKOO|nr:tRNA epoxyqueuosine(34) reductase QueG [Alkaliphilus oremlandii]ABW18454.1 domain of unknown function DUF1730 [Alkaliphilus oremlandii OhILAs]
MNLKEKIVQYSKSIGIDLIGFTDAGPFDDLRQILLDRKINGKLSGFEEEDIQLRVDPRKTLDTAKSIIVIAMSYYVGADQLPCSEKPKFYGELARTAWGKDYHLVLKEKLNQLADFIKNEEEDFQYKAFVDTGPLVDRYVANRSGIGFYGYNSAIINKTYGSWIFIGYMINNMAFEEDKSLENVHCYGCNLCIEQCPTSAIEGPYQFDANKCLSNILQQKRDIAEDVRLLIGKKIYGCDICQNVCPHNKGIKEMTTKEFMPKNPSHCVDLIELLHISNKEYNEIFKGNASGWRGKKTLQRNAIIALGNYKDENPWPHLIPMLKDERPDIRKITIETLYSIHPQKTVQLISSMKGNEKDQEVLMTIHKYLDNYKNK